MSQPTPTGYLLRPRVEPRRDPAHRYAFIGVPHDAATSLGNPGARFAPAALRGALKDVFDWRLRDGRLADVDAGIVDLSAVEVADFGDVALSYHDTALTVEQTAAAVAAAVRAGYVPIVAGGDHGVSYPAIRAVHDSMAGHLGLIQVDAHHDLMDCSDRQGRYSGSSGMRRSLDLPRLAGPNLVAAGSRGYTTVEQYEAAERRGVHRISATRFAELGAAEAARLALAWARAGTDALYLTVDLDVVEPGQAPGTGWPEPGGLTAQQLIDFVRAVAPHAAALDVVELNPIYDTPARATALLAARLVLDFITVRVRAANPAATG